MTCLGPLLQSSCNLFQHNTFLKRRHLSKCLTNFLSPFLFFLFPFFFHSSVSYPLFLFVFFRFYFIFLLLILFLFCLYLFLFFLFLFLILSFYLSLSLFLFASLSFVSVSVSLSFTIEKYFNPFRLSTEWPTQSSWSSLGNRSVWQPWSLPGTSLVQWSPER